MNKCPNCGYDGEVKISKYAAVMNHYVNAAGKKVVLNTDQESFNDKYGVLFIKVDANTGKPVKEFPKAPTPKAPTPAPTTTTTTPTPTTTPTTVNK